MPPAIGAALAAGAVAGAGAAIGGVTIGSLGILGSALVIGGSTAALNLAESVLSPQPRMPVLPDFAGRERGITQLVRGSVEASRVIYGERIVSGVLVFAETTGDAREHLHLVIALAGHEVEAIGDVWFHDERVRALAGAVDVADGRFAGKARIKKHLGADAQAADADLVAEVAAWTTAHRLAGVAYLYVRLTFDRDVFPTGIPNVKAAVKGRKVADPRDSITRWTDNAALCLRDYLTAGFGLGADPAIEIDEAAMIAAANVCDEDAPLPSDPALGFDFTADPASDLCAQTVASGASAKPLHLGDRLSLATTGALPGGLDGAGPFHAIPVTETTFKLAASLANARAGVAIDITSAGTGTQTLTRSHQPRYTTNGVIGLDGRPVDVVADLVTPLFGTLSYSQGLYTLFAGGWRGPASVTLTEDDLRDSLAIRPRPAKRTLHNAVRGVFADRDAGAQPSAFPPVTNATFEAQDGGERIWRDIELGHVTDTWRAQRRARLANERDRQGLVVEFPAKLTALRVAVGDVIALDIKRGADRIFAAKPFEIVGWSLAADGGVDLTLQETAAAIYSDDPAAMSVSDIAPNTSLPRAFDPPPPPSGLTLVRQVVEGPSGSSSRIKTTWIGPADHRVTEAGSFEVQFKKSADPAYEPSFFVDGREAQTFIAPVVDGSLYDVRLRSVANPGSTRSAWAEVLGFPVGDVLTIEDWGLVTDTPTTSEDWSQVSLVETLNEDWGLVA